MKPLKKKTAGRSSAKYSMKQAREERLMQGRIMHHRKGNMGRTQTLPKVTYKRRKKK